MKLILLALIGMALGYTQLIDRDWDGIPDAAINVGGPVVGGYAPRVAAPRVAPTFAAAPRIAAPAFPAYPSYPAYPAGNTWGNGYTYIPANNGDEDDSSKEAEKPKDDAAAAPAAAPAAPAARRRF